MMRFWVLTAALLLSLGFSVSSEAREFRPLASTGLSDDDLKGALMRQTSENHRSRSYKQARTELMGKIALQKKDEEYIVRDVYCEKDFGPADFKPGAHPRPGYIPDPNILNTEHTWPQSKFGRNSRESQKSDLHHLFPTDNELNSDRGNHPLGEVSRPKRELKCPTSKAGANDRGDYVFEPPVAHRGNAARALFYFSVRYGLKIDETQENVLRKWHIADPVDDFERSRNDAVERVQGNRNPFIDEPELVDRIHNF